MYETVLYQYHFADPVGLDQQPADRQWDEDQPGEGHPHPPAHTHTRLDYTPPEGCVHSLYREVNWGDISLPSELDTAGVNIAFLYWRRVKLNINGRE